MKLHTIIANHVVVAISEKAVLAVNFHPEAPEPYVCWLIGADGTVHTGRYFTDRMEAEWCFAARSFEWFEDNAQINMIDQETND